MMIHVRKNLRKLYKGDEVLSLLDENMYIRMRTWIAGEVSGDKAPTKECILQYAEHERYQ